MRRGCCWSIRQSDSGKLERSSLSLTLACCDSLRVMGNLCLCGFECAAKILNWFFTMFKSVCHFLEHKTKRMKLLKSSVSSKFWVTFDYWNSDFFLALEAELEDREMLIWLISGFWRLFLSLALSLSKRQNQPLGLCVSDISVASEMSWGFVLKTNGVEVNLAV